MTQWISAVLAGLLVVSATPAHASESEAAHHPMAPLPPVLEWSGPSENLALAPDHEWATPCEESRLLESPDYDETVAWLWRLVEAADELEMVSLGQSPELREIWAVIAST